MSFTRYNSDETVVSSERVVSPIWTGDLATLTSFFSSSTQESGSAGRCFLSIYNLQPGTSGSEVQFSVAYGHISGSGSAPYNQLIPGATPTRNIYGQYRSLIFGDENASFTFGISGSSRDIFAMTVNRSRYRESLGLGTLNLRLASGSNALFLTDNSKDSPVTNFIGSNRVYNIVSGSAGSSYNTASVQTNSGSYGYFFPDLGIILLNPRALALPYASGGIGINVDETNSITYTSAINNNNRNFFELLRTTGSFAATAEETISARFFFTHVKNGDYNYTTNPTIIDSTGNLLFASLVDNPTTYITTVGLYNDSNELLAVAKLSKPLSKNFTKEMLLRIKLEF